MFCKVCLCGVCVIVLCIMNRPLDVLCNHDIHLELLSNNALKHFAQTCKFNSAVAQHPFRLRWQAVVEALREKPKTAYDGFTDSEEEDTQGHGGSTSSNVYYVRPS